MTKAQAPRYGARTFLALASLSCLASPMQAQTKIQPTEPTPIDIAQPMDSRFGLNISNSDRVEENQLLGIRWARFENAKWPFASPSAHHYEFNDGVAPWNVSFDGVIGSYREHGFGILPMMFQTPEWAGAELPGATKDPGRDAPPKDAADFGEYCFQFAARYGGTKVAEDKLLTDDKVSGKGWIQYFEIWNEPNLNPRRGDQVPTWGPWRLPMSDFWPVFRAGAEAVKAADPTAKVTSPGFAGMTAETVDVLRTHVYPDGKRPLDFVDVINVHFYSGKAPPETAGHDPNTDEDLEGVRYDEHLRRLVAWRDEYRPGAPIWLTETGHDTGGPIGISEEMQAARLPRNLMMGIQNGIDRIFIYREKGSTPTKHAAAGLLRNDYTRKPGWYTIATLTRQLHLAEPVCRLPYPDENVWLYLWQRDGQPMVTAWTVEGQAELSLDLGRAQVTDAFGHTTEVDSTKGLAIDDFPRYLSDLGRPEALKPLEAEAEKIKNDRASQMQELAQQPAYLFDFGANPEPLSLYIGKMRDYQQVSHSQAYSADAGYGFEGPGREDDFQHYHKMLQDKYFAVLRPNTAFRVDLEPGHYTVEMLAEASRGKSRQFEISGADEAIEFTLEAKNREETVLEFHSTGEPLRISADGEWAIRWLTIVRKPGE